MSDYLLSALYRLATSAHSAGPLSATSRNPQFRLGRPEQNHHGVACDSFALTSCSSRLSQLCAL
jgi:hypothetical protein